MVGNSAAARAIAGQGRSSFVASEALAVGLTLAGSAYITSHSLVASKQRLRAIQPQTQSPHLLMVALITSFLGIGWALRSAAWLRANLLVEDCVGPVTLLAFASSVVQLSLRSPSTAAQRLANRTFVRRCYGSCIVAAAYFLCRLDKALSPDALFFWQRAAGSDPGPKRAAEAFSTFADCFNPLLLLFLTAGLGLRSRNHRSQVGHLHVVGIELAMGGTMTGALLTLPYVHGKLE